MKTKYKKEYIIRREKWACGGDALSKDRRFANLGDAQMLNTKGRMCCLGQMCNIDKVPKKNLIDRAFPDDVEDKRVPSWMLSFRGLLSELKFMSKVACKMAATNDNNKITQAVRESRIKALGKRAGIKVTFKGKLGGRLRKK